jgi:hypothetical protein
MLRVTVGVVFFKKRGDAITAPSRLKFGGLQAHACANDQLCAEGSCRRSISYTEDIVAPAAVLTAWPGGLYAGRRRTYEKAVDAAPFLQCFET